MRWLVDPGGVVGWLVGFRCLFISLVGSLSNGWLVDWLVR